jgi:hypothetical protein
MFALSGARVVVRPGCRTLKGRSMDQEQKVEIPADDRSNEAARKPWHAPRFFVTDIIATNTMCTTGGVEASPNLAS